MTRRSTKLWEELLLNFEAVGSSKADVSVYAKGICCMLISGPFSCERDGIVSATLLSASGMSAWATINEYMTWDYEEPVGTVKLRWNITEQNVNKFHKYWMIHVAENDYFHSGYDYKVLDDSCIIPIGNKSVSGEEFRILELFAGYFGGWHRACQHLAHISNIPSQVVAVESDIRACIHYAAALGVPLFEGHQGLSQDLLTQVTSSCIIHADVTNLGWLPPVGAWSPDCICISSPCQPWSSASVGLGLLSMMGLLTPEALMLGKFLQPSFILLENVVGMHKHPDFPLILRTIAHIGYQVIWMGTSELSNVCPVKRPRWLAILRRVDSQEVMPRAMDFFLKQEGITPISFQSVLYNNLVDYSVLGLTDEIKRLASQPEFMPGGKRKQSNPAEVFASRCHTGWNTLPCFLASYGNQHAFIHEAVGRPCLAHYAKIGDAEPRHWHPIEVMMHHMPVGPALVPKEMVEAWHAMGNQISVPHACLLLLNMFRMSTKVDWEVSTEEVLKQLYACRTHTGNGSVQTTDVGFWISTEQHSPLTLSEQQIANIQECFATCGKSFLPERFWWDLSGFHGFEVVLNHPQEELLAIEDGDPVSQVTELDESNEAVEPSPTLPMPIYIPVQMILEHIKRSAWARSDVEVKALVEIWEGHFQISNETTQEDDTNEVLTMCPSDAVIPHGSSQRVIPFLSGQALTMHVLAADQPTLHQLSETTGTDLIFDAFGPLDPKTVLVSGEACFDFRIRSMYACDPVPMILAAFHAASVTYAYSHHDDVWIIHIHADPVPCGTLVSLLAHCINPDDLLRTGRDFKIIRTDTGAMIRFEPFAANIPLPPKAFSLVLAVALTRSLFNKLPVEDGVEIKVKWFGRHIWHGIIDKKMTSDVMVAILQVGLSPWAHFTHQRLVVYGKLFNHGTVEQAIAPMHVKVPVFHAVAELWGGGGQVKNSTKCQHRAQVKNSIATSLLERGIPLEWAHLNVDKMLDTIGVKSVVPIAGQAPGAIRDSRIDQLFLEANMELPVKPTKGIHAPQALRLKQRRKQQTPLDPKLFQVDCQYIQNEDGSAPSQISDVRGNATGICLTDLEAARPWLIEGATLSADELGLLLLGTPDIETRLERAEVLLPFRDPQGQVLLMHATLFQLGAKKLSIKPWENQDVKAVKSKVCSLTLWESDWREEEWKLALTRTNQFIRDVLALQGMDILEATWGRSLRKGKLQATIHEASSIQLHASVPAESFDQFLACTGYNKIWAIPKEEYGQLSDSYRMLWVPTLKHDIAKVKTLAAQMTGNCGLVRGRNTLGIRVSKSNFAEAFRKVYPNDEVPEDISSRYLFKLEPLPFGCNNGMLKEWSKAIGWKLRPLRALGAKAWLVASGDQPPPGVLSWNGSPVLATSIVSKTSQARQPIAAGPRFPSIDVSKSPNSLVNKSNASPDPWSTWYANHPGQAAPAAPVAARQVQGPVEQRLTTQDEKIQNLQEQMQAVLTAQEQQKEVVNNIRDEQKGLETRLGAQVTQAIDAVKSELSASLAGAFAQQSSSFEANMRDFRSLLIEAKRKKPEAGDAEMSS